MSIETILSDLESVLSRLRSHLSDTANAEIKAAQNEAHDVIHTGEDYIRVHGLQDLAILAETFVMALVPGGSWTGMLASLKAQAVTQGIALVDGAEAVVAAKVQSDLIATGKLPAPAAKAA